jgi:hypothetical protein
MAEVFRAKATGVEGFEKLVAIKRILPNIAEDDEFITMFIDEAKIAVQLTHANIAQIYDLGKIEDSYFIALEFVSGKDLRTIFERARKRGEILPIPMSCYVVSRICEGLDYAHRKKDAQGQDLQIVHRDVSPQNLLVSYEGEVKIIDFGIAKAANKASKTQAGILKGKFGYMSPEQVRGLPIDRRSDVFSVGVVLYELLTGERLFVGESDFSTLEKVRNVEIMPPTTYNRRIPEELEAIVLRALSREPEERFQHSSELQEELTRFLILSGNMFSRKDLAQYMKQAFAEDIHREQAALDQFRQGPAVPPPVPSSFQLPRPMLLNAAGQPVEDDMATRVYDARPDFEAAGGDPAEVRRVAVPVATPRPAPPPESAVVSHDSQPSAPMYRSTLHEGARRRKVIIAATSLSVLTAAVVLVFYLRTLESSRPAKLEVVTSAGAEVQLCDGQSCKSLGVVPASGTLSSAHVTGKFRLVIEKAGCGKRELQITLVSKQTNSFGVGDLSCAAPLAGKGAFRLESDPPGAQVKFAAKEASGWTGMTPLSRREVPAGTYEAEVVKKDYFTRKVNVTVQPGTEQKLTVSLPAQAVKIEIDTEPTGAHVVVLDAASGKRVAEPRKKTPLAVRLFRPTLESAFKVEVSKRGYEEWSGPVVFSGQPTQKLTQKAIELEKTGKPKKKKRRAEVPAPPTPTAIIQTQAPAEPQFGTLDVNLKGLWAYVHIDGKDTGKATPLLGMKLKTGRYRITLVRQEVGFQDEFYVDIAANQPTRAVRNYKTP